MGAVMIKELSNYRKANSAGTDAIEAMKTLLKADGGEAMYQAYENLILTRAKTKGKSDE
ncbi:hypothetical protein N9K75_02840 [bacterium]|nr:hypothetical protein [bacterium]